MGILVLEIHQIENLQEGKFQVISKFLTQAVKDNGVRDRGTDWRIKNLALSHSVPIAGHLEVARGQAWSDSEVLAGDMKPHRGWNRV